MRYWTVGLMAVLAGCVAQVRVAEPPPPPIVYAPRPPPPPPPPAYAPPDVAYQEEQASEPPPPLPDYEQPPCPEDGYLWTPGYWAYGPGGYYWVPGTWVEPPRVGVLWTPGYWGFVGGVYLFHVGYWGPHVGFYGGVNYGYGYVGTGYAGGRWAGDRFAYNQSVTNVNTTVIHNTYNETVINNVTVNKVSYNGPGGTAAAPTAQERQVAQEPHVPATPLQRQHVQEAARNPALFARANQGRPPIAATPKPAVFNAPGVVGAHGASIPPQRAALEPGRPAFEAHGNPGAPAPGAPAAGAPRALVNPPSGQPGRPAQPGTPGVSGTPGTARALRPPPNVRANTQAVAKPPVPPKPPAPPKQPKDKRAVGEGEHRD